MPTKIPCPLCLRSVFTSALEAESRLGCGVVGVMEGDAGEDVSLGAAVGVGLRGAGDTRSASDGAIVVVFS